MIVLPYPGPAAARRQRALPVPATVDAAYRATAGVARPDDPRPARERADAFDVSASAGSWVVSRVDKSRC